jgi:uncharacterized LabA/DUF88 family protein
MNPEKNKDLKLAVLIDADNVPYSNIKGMLEEIAKYGTPTTKRIYGDWTKPTVSGWKNVLLENAITPVQQYSYTTGKNATDSAMIIDAMDILYSGKVNGFCLISSDSDFTRLATRLRESGMKVIGIGEKKTPSPFIAACDRFIYIEVLAKDTQAPPSKRTARKKTQRDKELHKIDKRTLDLIFKTIEDLGDDDGWAFLGDVGNLIIKKSPEFDPRNYGFLKLTPMLKYLSKDIEIDERNSEDRRIKHVFVRLKNH